MFNLNYLEMKTRALKTVKILINIVLVILITLIIAGTVSLITGNSKNSIFSFRINNNGDLVTMYTNNLTLVLRNDKLEDAEYYNTIKTSFFKYVRLSTLNRYFFFFLISMQLSLLFKSLPYNIFQNIKNTERIKRISLIVLLWVIADFAVRFYPRAVIPDDLIYSAYDLNRLDAGFMPNFISINFNMVFIAVIIYFLSIVFEKGNELQKQANLTV